MTVTFFSYSRQFTARVAIMLSRAAMLFALLFPLAASAGDYTNYLRLFSFAGTNGANPYANLIEASDGKLYGTALEGGLTNAAFPKGAGTAFSLNKDGTEFKVLHYFGSSGTDGQNPFGALVEGRFGALYGTTRNGGVMDFGTIFKLDKEG